jgi:uncharacterized protein (TIGR03792 family)
MVIEWLRFRVLAGERDRFLAADTAIWTPFLAGCTGYVRKVVWCDRERSNEVVMLVYWESYTLWKAVDPGELARVEDSFKQAIGQAVAELVEVRCFEPWEEVS